MTGSPKELAIGLVFAACGVAMLALGTLYEIRPDLDGLKTVTGTVIESTGINRGRSGGLELRVVLAGRDGKIELMQEQAGDLADRLRRGEAVRAWVDEKPADVVKGVPVYAVWQVERGSEVPLPLQAMNSGRKTWRYLAFLTGLVALTGGLVAIRTGAAARATERETT